MLHASGLGICLRAGWIRLFAFSHSYVVIDIRPAFLQQFVLLVNTQQIVRLAISLHGEILPDRLVCIIHSLEGRGIGAIRGMAIDVKRLTAKCGWNS